MAIAIFEAMRHGLQGVLDLLMRMALPLGLFGGLVIAAGLLAISKGSASPLPLESIRKWGGAWAGYVGISLLLIACWSGLRSLQPLVRDASQWQESASASADPAPYGPPIYQPAPVAARMVPKTYTRTLELPPDFLPRLGTEGVAALSPYLTDPTAENVSKLVDSFKKAGTQVLFTRQLTREDEAPMAFERASVNVKVHRLKGKAFESDFSGTFVFSNSTPSVLSARFLFSLPQSGGTIRDLKVSVDRSEISEPDSHGSYAWKGDLSPGEKRTAVVTYKSVGEGSWSYDVGSNRRSAKSFDLTLESDGPVKFQRQSLLPTSTSGNKSTWNLTNVVTSQQIMVVFDRNQGSKDGVLQGLALLPPTFILFIAAFLGIALRRGEWMKPDRLAHAILAVGLGLGSTIVLLGCIPPLPAMFLGPLVGAVTASVLLGRPSLALSIPVSFLPATALSPTHTGIWVLGLVVSAVILTLLFVPIPNRSRPLPTASER